MDHRASVKPFTFAITNFSPRAFLILNEFIQLCQIFKMKNNSL